MIPTFMISQRVLNTYMVVCREILRGVREVRGPWPKGPLRDPINRYLGLG